MSDGTDLSAVLPTPPYKATINGWLPQDVGVRLRGSLALHHGVQAEERGAWRGLNDQR